jgi:3-deoxy-manno-octulosonate cytidylyltransferase (CMP-KDO synthetase)
VHPVTFRTPFERTSQGPRVLVVIPARYNSTRFPGKALADLGGRPMIEHVYRRAAAANRVDAVIVATDDARIAEAVERFGGTVCMTRADHRSGTDRIAEAVAPWSCTFVVNVQGDEPLIDPRAIDAVLTPLEADPSIGMSTARQRITDPDDYDNRDVVKVVVAANGDALYFSRAPLPYIRTDAAEGPTRSRHPIDQAIVVAGVRRPVPVHKHVGLYGFRRDFLLTFAGLPPTPLEVAESLEQLRALEHGFRIRTVEIAYDSIGVDTPEDLERVRQQLAPATRA